MTGLLFMILLQTCATTMTPRESELSIADNFFKAGEYDQAITAYKKVLQQNPDTDRAADAQFSIAYTLVYYDNPKINYPLALVEFKKFITLYPDDNRAEEAQNWYQVLKALNDAKGENAVLSNKIQQLKQLDIQRERSIH